MRRNFRFIGTVFHLPLLDLSHCALNDVTELTPPLWPSPLKPVNDVNTCNCAAPKIMLHTLTLLDNKKTASDRQQFRKYSNSAGAIVMRSTHSTLEGLLEIRFPSSPCRNVIIRTLEGLLILDLSLDFISAVESRLGPLAGSSEIAQPVRT